VPMSSGQPGSTSSRRCDYPRSRKVMLRKQRRKHDHSEFLGTPFRIVNSMIGTELTLDPGTEIMVEKDL
jgi:hypothetical protein